jgi:hypothetical protein
VKVKIEKHRDGTITAKVERTVRGGAMRRVFKHITPESLKTVLGQAVEEVAAKTPVGFPQEA